MAPPKDRNHTKISRQPSAGNMMTSIFRHPEGLIYVDFLPPCATVYGQYYGNLLLNYVHTEIHKESPGKLSRETNLLHDNAYPRRI